MSFLNKKTSLIALIVGWGVCCLSFHPDYTSNKHKGDNPASNNDRLDLRVVHSGINVPHTIHS